MQLYKVTYKNSGKSEQTQPTTDKAKAHKTAQFLKFQGAKSVRVVQENQ